MEFGDNPYEPPAKSRSRSEDPDRIVNYLIAGIVVVVTLLIGIAIGFASAFLFVFYPDV